MDNSAISLSHVRVLVTRPGAAGQELCRRIAAAGGQAFLCPLITTVQDLSAARGLPDNLSLADAFVFISPAAVKHGLHFLKTHAGADVSAWPPCYAAGPGTAKALAEEGICADTPPQGQQGSEGLLQLPRLQHPAGKCFLIIKGAGGRELLQSRIKARGGEVWLCPVYRRENKTYPDGKPEQIIRAGRINAVVVTSGQVFESLCAGVRRKMLEKLIMVVPGERVAGLVRRAGYQAVCATGADNNAMLYRLSALCPGQNVQIAE